MAEVSESEAVTCERATPKWVYGPNGKLREVPPNTLARQWNPETGEPEGALIEESRTNLLLWSEDFTNAVWGKSGLSVTPNATSAPGGGTTGDKLVEDESDGAHNFHQSVSQSTSGFVLTGYFKSGERRHVALLITASSGAAPYAVYDLADGLVTDAGNGATAEIEPLVDGWYRCALFSPADTVASNGYYRMCNGPRYHNRLYQGDGTSGIYIWGVQLEEGRQPSSYIPTEDAPVTRAADNVSRELGEEFNPSSGTVVFTFTRKDLKNNSTIFKFGDDDGVGGFNGIGLQSITAGALGHIRIRHPDLPQMESSNFALSLGVSWRIALSYGGGVFTCFQNGTQVATVDYSAADQDALETLFRRAYIGSGNPMGGAFNRTATEFSDIQYIPRTLSEAELVELTK